MKTYMYQPPVIRAYHWHPEEICHVVHYRHSFGKVEQSELLHSSKLQRGTKMGFNVIL